MKKTMPHTTILLLGLALTSLGSLLIAGQNPLVQFGGMVLGVVGVACMIIGLLRGWEKING